MHVGKAPCLLFIVNTPRVLASVSVTGVCVGLFSCQSVSCLQVFLTKNKSKLKNGNIKKLRTACIVVLFMFMFYFHKKRKTRNNCTVLKTNHLRSCCTSK